MEKLFFEHFLVTVTKVFLMAFFLYLLIKPILKILKIRNSFRERALKLWNHKTLFSRMIIKYSVVTYASMKEISPKLVV